MTEDPLFPVEDFDPNNFLGKSYRADPELVTKEQARRNLQKALSLQEPLAPYQHDVQEPNTSFLAAHKQKGKVATELVEAYNILLAYPLGLSDFELAERLSERLGRHVRPTSAGARRIALRDQYNLVEYAGFTRKTDSGASSKVWRVKK